MKKYTLPLSLALAATLTMSAETKLDGKAQAYINFYNELIANPGENSLTPIELPFEVNTKSRAASTATVFVTMADGVTADDIEAQGFFIKAQAGKMLVAEGSIDAIVALGDTELVTNIAFGGKAEPSMMRARAFTGVDDIHNGTNGLSRSYTGDGVICGIFDIGIDVNHPNFLKKDQSESRVKRLWYFSSSDGTYKERSTAKEIESFTSDTSSDSHGTHTLGCMAGAYNELSGRNAAYTYLDENGDFTYYGVENKGRNPYYGVAYDSELAVACGSLDNDNTTVAVTKMVEYAKEQNKPIVVSLSFGSIVGPHDEYDTFASYIDELGKDAIICIAAGNDGDYDMSIRKKLTSADSKVKTFFETSSYGYLSIYSNDATEFTITPIIYDKSTGQMIWNNYTVDKSTTITAGYSNGVQFSEFNGAFDTSYVNFVVDKNVGTSNRYSCTISYSLYNNTTTNKSGNKVFGIIINGVDGQTIEIASSGELTDNGVEGFDKATPDFSICSSSCGKNVIIVGAYNTNDELVPIINSIGATDISMNALTFTGSNTGEVSSFTSYATLSDGRTLPTVCAPGCGVISSVNSYQTEYSKFAGDYNYTPSAYTTYNGKKYFWAQMSGTSMATPIVAGSIATWLEAYPQLTVQEAQEIIKETAIQDEDTAKGNSVQWGAGKFNALGGLKKILGTNGVANVSVDNNNFIVTSNGNNTFNVFAADADNVNAQIYNIAGQLVANQTARGNELNVDATNLSKGIYVIRVNGKYSQRVVVR